MDGGRLEHLLFAQEGESSPINIVLDDPTSWAQMPASLILNSSAARSATATTTRTLHGFALTLLQAFLERVGGNPALTIERLEPRDTFFVEPAPDLSLCADKTELLQFLRRTLDVEKRRLWFAKLFVVAHPDPAASRERPFTGFVHLYWGVQEISPESDGEVCIGMRSGCRSTLQAPGKTLL